MLAWAAERRGLTFKILDPGSSRGPHLGTPASRVAGGVFDPIAGSKFSPAWNAMSFVRETRQLFAWIQESLGAQIYHPIASARAFETEEEIARFQARLGQYALAEIPVREVGDFPAGFKAPFGGFESESAGWVDIVQFLDRSRERWLAEGSLLECEAPLDAIVARRSFDGDDYVDWCGETFKYAALCVGRAIRAHSGFGTLPWSETKGQTLVIRADSLDQRRILKREVAFVPRPGGKFRIAATYENNPSDDLPTPEGKTELLQGISDAFPQLPYEILEHLAGLRPHLKDHYPVVGSRGCIGILGGLGSKGVLWAPLLSSWLLDHWLMAGEIPRQVSLSRFSRI